MRTVLAATAFLLAARGALGQPPFCHLAGSWICYADAPVRPVPFLAVEASHTLDVHACADACTTSGFSVLALTSNPTAAYCYCGASVSAGATQAPAASCALPCPSDAGDNCGAVGFSAVYNLSCSEPLPPTPTGPPLAPGRACSQPEVRALPFCDAGLPRDARVADLVARLTLPELASQLQARSSAAVPRLGLPPFYWGTNQLHGIAGAHCVEAGRCPVSWPDGAAMAATWNESAWRAMGAAAGVEMRALYNVAYANASNPGLGLTSWGPTINLLRDTRWGRTQESASECPTLAGRFGAQVSLGLQQGSEGGGGPSDPRFLLAVSGLKHFAAYSLEQYGPPEDPARYTRQTFNAAVTAFDAADSYFRPFRAAIVDGGAAGVMYAANEFQPWDPAVDPTPPSPLTGGVPCCLSTYLLSVLAAWNFSGYRCTDGGQISQAISLHKYVPTLDQAIGLAARAQSDIADGDEYAVGLAQAWLSGNVSLAQARVLLGNAFAVRYRLGLFDPPGDQPYERLGAADVGTPDNWAAAAQASRDALVLLENGRGVLPLAPGPRWARPGALAVIGPHANDTLTLQGNYGGAYCPPGPHGPVTDCFPAVFQALQEGYAPGAVWAPGTAGVNASDPALQAAAAAAAAAADAVVLVLGLDQTIEREQLDRWDMRLPQPQRDLLAAVAAAVSASGAPVIVVLVHGGALAAPELKATPAVGAVLDALYPGVTGGGAIAGALFGAFSPGGKLPFTVYDVDYAAQYNFTNMSIAAPQTYVDPATGQPAQTPGGRTYRYYAGAPLWPFGHGLSYTNWSLAWAGGGPPCGIGNCTLTPADSGGGLALSVDLTNAGFRDGDEVLQAYVEPLRTGGSSPLLDPAAQGLPFLPLRSLAGFVRCTVKAGATAAAVALDLPLEAFALTRGDGSRALIDGAAFTVRVCLGPLRGGDLTVTATLAGFGPSSGAELSRVLPLPFAEQ